MKPLLPGAAAIACLAFACGASTNVEDALRIRAANDFNCAQRDLVVEPLGGDAYRARGCDQTRTYVCVDRGGADEVVCERKP